MRGLLVSGLLASLVAFSAPADASDRAPLIREVARVKAAIEVGTDRQEMAALAKSVIVELYMAKRAGLTDTNVENSTIVLIDALRSTVTHWDLCPEHLWRTNFPACKQASDEFFKSIGSGATAYENARLPWKPFPAYALVEVAARADKALAAFR